MVHDVSAQSLILSKSAFAARRGVGASTVSMWIERKRISGGALTEDGRINVAEAEKQLGVRLDAVRSDGAIAAARANDLVDAEPTVRDQILSVELEQKRRRLQAEKGVYVRADQVRAERSRALSQIVAALDNWIPELAGELGLDHDRAGQLRNSWRRFRERQADALLAEAQAMPELLSDAA